MSKRRAEEKIDTRSKRLVLAKRDQATHVILSEAPTLSSEQAQIVQAIQSGKNVFFTGPAGTGKSYTLHHLSKYVFPVLPGITRLTASTGIAAINIGGTTLHSWACIQLGLLSVRHYATEISRSPRSKRRWTFCKRLIIDEISMIGGTLWTKLEEIGRIVRNDPRPFGGIQLIVCGDFLQLPAVKDSCLITDTKAWKDCKFQSIELRQVHRQTDPSFIHLLHELRVGRMSEANWKVLESRQGVILPSEHGILPTRLYATRRDVAEENLCELQKLEGKEELWKAKDWFAPGAQGSYEKQLDNVQAPKELRLKPGAQVILLCNLDTARNLANGTRGVVIDSAVFGQCTIPGVQNCGNTMTEEEKASSKAAGKLRPIVKFSEKGKTWMEMIDSYTWDIYDGLNVVASRTQIPLALAWALTIHKSQGQTLRQAEAALSDIFEQGQMYVALSRLQSLDGLSITGLSRTALRTNAKVVKWYRQTFPENPMYQENAVVTTSPSPPAPPVTTTTASS